MGFQENDTGVSMYHPRPIGGPSHYLQLKKGNPEKLKKLFKLVSSHRDDKRFRLANTLYSRALSGDDSEFDVRFLLLSTALECLYLPESDQELTLRLRLRVANLLGLMGFGKPQDIYDMVDNLWKIRNAIVHSGTTKKLNTRRLAELVNIVRASLIHYLREKRLFNEKTLTSLCLKPYVAIKE